MTIRSSSALLTSKIRSQPTQTIALRLSTSDVNTKTNNGQLFCGCDTLCCCQSVLLFFVVCYFSALCFWLVLCFCLSDSYFTRCRLYLLYNCFILYCILRGYIIERRLQCERMPEDCNSSNELVMGMMGRGCFHRERTTEARARFWSRKLPLVVQRVQAGKTSAEVEVRWPRSVEG